MTSLDLEQSRSAYKDALKQQAEAFASDGATPPHHDAGPLQAEVQTAVKNNWNALEQQKNAEFKKWGKRAANASTAFLLILAAVAAIGGAIGIGNTSGETQDQYISLIIAGVGVPLSALILGLLWFKQEGGGIAGFIVGQDKRLSTSLLQVLLWTGVVVFAFVMFISELALGVELEDKEGFAGFDETYLFLLGGPFAAAVLAKFTAVVKTDSETTQQAPADKPQTKDLASDDTGNISLTDFQFLLFNFVAIAFFGVAFAQDPSTLPTIPATLVGLTSISALTYVGGKVVNSNPPSISSVSIVSGGDGGKLVPGQTVIRVVGKNFLPSGTDEDKDLNVTVLVGDTELPDLLFKSNTELQGRVPAGVATGAATTIRVRTAEGATSESSSALEVREPI